MGDPAAGLHIVRGIQDTVEGIGWRWAHERPELAFELPRAEDWKLRMDFAFPDSNFKVTGPVTVSFFINGKLLGTERYTTPGEKRFEKAVPPGWLQAGRAATVSAEIDPPWIAPADKVKLGFVLYGAGFVP
jgi:hypothetical protein